MLLIYFHPKIYAYVYSSMDMEDGKRTIYIRKCVIILYLLYSLLQLSMDPALLLFRAFFDLSSILQKTETRHLIAFYKILKPYDSANQHWIVKLKKNQIKGRENISTYIYHKPCLPHKIEFSSGKGRVITNYKLFLDTYRLVRCVNWPKKTLEQ